MATVTLNGANTAPRQSPVVISEIMYHPISEDDNDEYVELYNRSGGAVNLSGENNSSSVYAEGFPHYMDVSANIPSPISVSG